jgi:hypothetical protein
VHTYSAKPPRPLAPPEHLVAWLKLLYAAANRLNPPCYVHSEYLVFWLAQRPEADNQRFPSQEVPVKRIHGCCMNFY